MRRDEVVKALESQRSNTDVQILIGSFLLDVDCVTYVEERDSNWLRILSSTREKEQEASR